MQSYNSFSILVITVEKWTVTELTVTLRVVVLISVEPSMLVPDKNKKEKLLSIASRCCLGH
jgi:hypothetical protein